jgi:hypothetical protein
MQLSMSNWVDNGPGMLYGSPFVSRCLLYRIYDRDCSFLIYHEPNVTSRRNTQKETGLTIFQFDTDVRSPDTAYICFAPSAKKELKELAMVSPIRIVFSKTTAVWQSLNDLQLCIEPCHLPMKGMFITGGDRGRSSQYQIANTAYHVQSATPIVNMGTRMPPVDVPFSCWKVSIKTIATAENYDLASIHDWSLSSFDAEADWNPKLEMRLERNSDTKRKP